MIPLPHWMIRFHQQDVETDQFEKETPVKLLDPRGRQFMWWLCKQYDATKEGVMGSACSLLEQFMSKQVKSYWHLDRNSSEWLEVQQQLESRIPLLASVCIALTTKMLSTENALTPVTISETLAKIFSSYTVKEVNTAEMEIFASIGFKIPLFTNVEKATMMATDVGMSGIMLEGVALVMELAEFYRLPLQEEIFSITSDASQDQTIHFQDTLNIRNVHFVAGAVIASSVFLMYQGPEPGPRLAILARCAGVYIKCIGDVIHHRLLQECKPFEDQSKKRKLDDTDLADD